MERSPSDCVDCAPHLKIDRDGTVWMFTNTMPRFIYASLSPNEFNFRLWRASAADLIRATRCDARSNSLISNIYSQPSNVYFHWRQHNRPRWILLYMFYYEILFTISTLMLLFFLHWISNSGRTLNGPHTYVGLTFNYFRQQKRLRKNSTQHAYHILFGMTEFLKNSRPIEL